VRGSGGNPPGHLAVDDIALMTRLDVKPAVASADDIAAHFAEIADWTTAKPYGQGGEQSAKFLARVQEKPLLG